MAMRYWNGGAWEEIGNFRYWNGGAWQELDTIYEWNGSSWVQVWPESTPEETFTYYANWTQSYDGNVANYSSYRDVMSYEGYSSYHGNESALFGFDDALMRSDLAGRDIKSVDLRLSQRWSYAGSGKTFHIQAHNHSSKPGSYTPGPQIAEVFLGRGQIGSITLPNSLGEQIRDGSERGVGLLYVDSNWGYCAGMSTTTVLSSSPESYQVVPSGTDQLPRLTIKAGG